ncbi:hypothetical protein [Catenovulum agarivorans]|uniref:hypothetical protein n=1 Tax=Catenovulum agarivorans TaxID=1172192 RepID=UPI0002EB2375|nr:hypothetical protein [Catenovulum agarivorans]
MNDSRAINTDTEIYIFENSLLSTLKGSEITPHKVGLKAFGLLFLPKAWYPPFFLVHSKSIDSISATDIQNFFGKLGVSISLNTKIIIRSNQNDENILDRGTHDSFPLQLSDFDTSKTILPKFDGYWIIQEFIKNGLQGHLSNERRVYHDARDWVWETEAEVGNSGKKSTGSINLRSWRDSSEATTSELQLASKMEFEKALENVAKWAHYIHKMRVHFEWVCDAERLYIVQADLDGVKKQGINPNDIRIYEYQTPNVEDLKIFKIASESDFNQYSKLYNTRIYKEIGYQVVNFFICDDQNTISKLLNNELTKELSEDLTILTCNPLVIRTDGTSLPENKKTMLPRSDELRNLSDAKSWLLNQFRLKITEQEIGKAGLCLIAHHFVPAISSAWSLAEPDGRRVRIESLWGIPEGLYWYSHDVFDVDTKVIEISPNSSVPASLKIDERLRFKDKFIAPDKHGSWVLHQTDQKSDWSSSISDWSSSRQYSNWVAEIAWNSRKIARVVGKPVVIMWFIDMPESLSQHKVMPWYHTQWEPQDFEFKAAPKKKNANEQIYKICVKEDWDKFKNNKNTIVRNSRVVVEPSDPELVRSQTFAHELAELAKKNNLIIELAGGILSHAFYMLSKHGATVECSDLYATEDEELVFNKLVRDEIPKSIVSGGEQVEVIKLEKDAYLEALKRKIVEESYEVLNAQSISEIREELADLREVINSLQQQLKITEEDIKEERKRKNEKRGGFNESLMLRKTALSASTAHSKKENKSLVPAPLINEVNTTISKVEELPLPSFVLHSDTRTSNNKSIKQFTLTIPFCGNTPIPVQISRFNIETKDSQRSTFEFKAEIDRNGADLKVKISISETPQQLQLDLE